MTTNLNTQAVLDQNDLIENGIEALLGVAAAYHGARIADSQGCDDCELVDIASEDDAELIGTIAIRHEDGSMAAARKDCMAAQVSYGLGVNWKQVTT